MSGIKRHIAVDTNGLPHAILVTTANITDRNGALEMFMLNKATLANVRNVLADGGYTGENFAAAAKEILGCTVEIAKRNELHTFAVIPQNLFKVFLMYAIVCFHTAWRQYDGDLSKRYQSGTV